MLDHPIVLIIFVVVALLRWLSQKSEAGTPDPERPIVPNQSIPRGGETQTEEERIRRFLEALGQPAGAKPPPKVVAKRETQPRVFSPLPPLTTVPPPLPTPPVPAAQAAPPPPVLQRVFTPAIVQETGFEVRDLGPTTVPSSSLPGAQRLINKQESLLSRLASTQGLRNAIVLREIFGPPRSLQPFDPIDVC